MYERKPGDGSLFQNRKERDNQPDVWGDFLGLDGKTYEIAGWQKATRNGDPWWSLKIQPKRERQQSRSHDAGNGDKAAQQTAGFDEKIPF